MPRLTPISILLITAILQLHAQQSGNAGSGLSGTDPVSIKAGDKTNDVFAQVNVQTNQPFWVTVRLRDHWVPANWNPVPTNFWQPERGYYFQPTNTFCGFIELRDAKGQKLRLLKPEVNSSNAYPASISLMSVGRIARSKLEEYSGTGLPPYLAMTPYAADGKLPSFQLTNYFRLSPSAAYELTIWPKVYKVSETNKDICRRVDLPPVSVKFKTSDKQD